MVDELQIELLVPAPVAAAIVADPGLHATSHAAPSRPGLDSRLGTAVMLISLAANLSQCASFALQVAEHACTHAEKTQTSFQITVRGTSHDEVIDISPTSESRQIAHTIEKAWTAEAEVTTK